MKKILLLNIILSMLLVVGCVNDLDVEPQDPSVILSGNVPNDPVYMQQVLGKIYASFIIPGQGGDNEKGPDISAGDPNFFTTMRALWNLQEITTDEALCTWSDVGIFDLSTQTWSPSNPFLTALYQRLSISITFANDFITLASKSSIEGKEQYIAEARFLRALAYFYHMDMFGNPPFTTEADGVGKYLPKQINRTDLFDYLVSELEEIEDVLAAPGNSYPQADQGAAWMLLARIYQNAEVYTGTPMWEKCETYCTKIIESGAYTLNSDYRHNFSADNHYSSNNEMIFAFEQDGVYTRESVGTTFLIQSCSDDKYYPANENHDLPNNADWNGNRMRKDFLNRMIDTLATYGGEIPKTDTFYTTLPDSRLWLYQKQGIDIPSITPDANYFGVGVRKFTNFKHDGTQADNYSRQYASTDYPIFRYSDAYLTRAEARYNLSNAAGAVQDINMVRERAYGDASGNITAAELDADFLLDERGREFYFEGHRRTDLIRFGKYTGNDFLWQWKGGDYTGTAIGSHMTLFPIPAEEISANANLKQNKGYN